LVSIASLERNHADSHDLHVQKTPRTFVNPNLTFTSTSASDRRTEYDTTDRQAIISSFGAESWLRPVRSPDGILCKDPPRHLHLIMQPRRPAVADTDAATNAIPGWVYNSGGYERREALGVPADEHDKWALVDSHVDIEVGER